MKRRMVLDGACIVCGSEDAEHAAKGKCRNCYMRDYMRKKREIELSTQTLD